MTHPPRNLAPFDPFGADDTSTLASLGWVIASEYPTLAAAITDAGSSSSFLGVYIGPGTFDVGAGLDLSALRSGQVFRGAGKFATILTTTVSANLLYCITGSRQDITISDMTLTHSGDIGIIGVKVLSTGISSGLRVERIRFVALRGTGVSGQRGISKVRVSDSTFHGLGVGRSNGVILDGGTHGCKIEGNEFLYLNSGVQLTTSLGVPKVDDGSDFTLFDNYFDGGWWTQVADFSGAASAVYTGTTLTDATAAFSGITVGVYVRAMAVVRTGTVSAINGTKLTDAGATFISASARSGYIVRSGSLFAIVSEVEAETSLDVEEWLSDSDRTPAAPPAVGASYTLYGISLGNVTGSTGTSITVTRWIDLDGNVATPSNGTRYEVSKYLETTHVQIGRSYHDGKIIDNTLLRGMADMLAIYADRVSIIGNTLASGQDIGVSVDEGRGATVIGNTIVHQGVNGIQFYHANDGIATANNVTDSCWTIAAAAPNKGGIAVVGGSYNKINGNWCRRVAGQMDYGVVIFSNDVSFPSTGNVVESNHTTGGIQATANIARGAYTDGTVFRDNEAPGGYITAGYDTGATNTKTNLTVTATWDPGSVGNGASTSTTIAAPGAVVGTQASASLSTLTAGWLITAVGTATDVVTVTILNATGGTVDLASGTLTVTLIQS